MAKDRKRSPSERNGKEEEEKEDKLKEEEEEEEEEAAPSKRDHERKSKRKKEYSSEDLSEEDKREKKYSRSTKKKKKKSRSSKRRRYSDEDSSSSSDSYESDSEMSGSDSESDGSDYSSEESESEDERRRRKRKERKRKESEYEKERRRKRREKEKKGRKKDKDGKDKKKDKKKKKKKGKEEKKGAVTNSWGKYGIIRETDMWNKRPEFTAWLSEVKQVNLETLPNWEEKQMFKQFMEDHNTATFPSKKYYSLDAYHRRQIEKEIKKGSKRANQAERTVFNDEEQRRLEMMQVREKQKEAEVETLKKAMQSGMAQAMKEQAQLREEMAYQYKLGNFEAAAAIQRRLDPDVA